MSEFGDSHVPNSKLREVDLPPNDATWWAIQEFALSFDGYAYWGSFERCAEIANTQDHATLTNLRTCLFFEQRRWRHFGEEPDDATMKYVHEILVNIRAMVRNGELE
jgi:hypothetical protein